MDVSEIKNSTILIVDDNPANLGMLFRYLTKYGFKVLLTSDGESALELINEEPPDIILLDILMPGLNGFEVCSKMKESEKTQSIPVIFLSALTDTSDKVKGFEAGGVDYITKPIQHEEVLARVAAHLTIRNQRNKLAKINVSKDRLFSIISHDLRSPFMSIIGSTQLLLDSLKEMDKDEIYDIVSSCHSSAKITFTLLENLLEWSRIQTNSLEFDPQNFHLYPISNKVINLYSERAKKKNITLDSNIDRNTKVFADENMSYTILRNLTSNALKFTETGGSISISSVRNDEYVELSVTDTGLGMSDEDMAKLFRIDIQHTTLGTSQEKGTGLGLILCKELVVKEWRRYLG